MDESFVVKVEPSINFWLRMAASLSWIFGIGNFKFSPFSSKAVTLKRALYSFTIGVFLCIRLNSLRAAIAESDDLRLFISGKRLETCLTSRWLDKLLALSSYFISIFGFSTDISSFSMFISILLTLFSSRRYSTLNCSKNFFISTFYFMSLLFLALVTLSLSLRFEVLKLW